jgi:hypothetical protein
MPKHTTILLLTLFVLVFCLADHGAYAFGAGNIPSFAYLEGKAFRHGDIEDAIAELVKRGGGGLAMVGLKSKFGGLDVKRIYFGNWLRDYSQAVDIAGLKKLQLQTIINLCMALGFLVQKIPRSDSRHHCILIFVRPTVMLPMNSKLRPKD